MYSSPHKLFYIIIKSNLVNQTQKLLTRRYIIFFKAYFKRNIQIKSQCFDKQI
jgi:hypothetical protein